MKKKPQKQTTSVVRVFLCCYTDLMMLSASDTGQRIVEGNYRIYRSVKLVMTHPTYKLCTLIQLIHPLDEKRTVL